MSPSGSRRQTVGTRPAGRSRCRRASRSSFSGKKPDGSAKSVRARIAAAVARGRVVVMARLLRSFPGPTSVRLPRDNRCTGASEGPHSQGRPGSKQETIDAPVAAGRYDREDEQRDVLMRLLEHPPVTRQIDQRQKELKEQADERRAARDEAKDEQQADAELGIGHYPLKNIPVRQDEVVDDVFEVRHQRPTATLVDFELKDVARLVADDEEAAIPTKRDLAFAGQFGETIGEEDYAHKYSQYCQPAPQRRPTDQRLRRGL